MSNEVQALEANIAACKKTVELAASLERLQSNRDFKKLIVEGYFEKEPVRLVHLLADQNMQKPEQQAAIHRSMMAVGQLNQYFASIQHQARLAQKSIEADEETIAELNVEGV